MWLVLPNSAKLLPLSFTELFRQIAQTRDQKGKVVRGVVQNDDDVENEGSPVPGINREPEE
jgi:hypothetical protein